MHQVDLDGLYNVSGVVVRGSPRSLKYCHSVTVQHSIDSATWTQLYDATGTEQVRHGAEEGGGGWMAQ